MQTNTDLPPDDILTPKEVARYLRISRSNTYSILYQKPFPILKLGRCVRVRKSDLLKWVEELTKKVQ